MLRFMIDFLVKKTLKSFNYIRAYLRYYKELKIIIVLNCSDCILKSNKFFNMFIVYLFWINKFLKIEQFLIDELIGPCMEKSSKGVKINSNFYIDRNISYQYNNFNSNCFFY